jgi:hypothetical protein
LVVELAEDAALREDFLAACKHKPELAFDTLLWTFNPLNEPGERNMPFILRPAQRQAVRDIVTAIREGRDLLVNKSRYEGATWLICGVYFIFWLLEEDSLFIVASRKEDLVDKAGSRDCLFYKFTYFNDNLPSWVKVYEAEKTHLHFSNPRNGSVIVGESTNESLGAGSRALSVMPDEFGRVEHKIAQNIRETLSDVTKCVIYNSTHFYGRGHPFAKLLYSGKIKIVELPWYKNPQKNSGLYRSPDLNKLEFFDDYYDKLYPKVFTVNQFAYGDLEREMLVNYPDAKISFVADGANKYRSPWYDAEVARRDPRDVAQNIDMNPVGSGDVFFDPDVMLSVRQRCRLPDYVGEVEFNRDKEERIAGVRFIHGGYKRLKIWGKLDKDRPPQNHNYIVAADIGLGTGASNSVAKIYDVNTSTLVGVFASSDVPPEEFGDIVTAICFWTGGSSGRPFLVWEANGPGGSFEKRIVLNKYDFVYRGRQKKVRSGVKTRAGWWATKESKYDLLLELRVAVGNGLRDKPIGKKLILYDEDSVREYEDYIFGENGEIGLSTAVDETTGARSAHGDRVIPDGLYVLALNKQSKAAEMEKMKTTFNDNCPAYRHQMAERERQKTRKEMPWLYQL